MEKLAISGGDKAIKTNNEKLFHWPIVTDEDIKAVTEVLIAGNMSGTEITKQFEKEYAKWNGTAYALATCNGTAGLYAAMWACGIGAGDEVICPSITCWASCTAALTLGATVNFCDVIPETLCLDPKDIEHRISDKTRAIIVVNYASTPAEWKEISAIAKKHNIKIIEDNSHAHGALYKGKMCGSFGDISVASLMAGKALAIGEGGMITTDSRDLYERCIAFGHYERTGLKSNFNAVDNQITSPELAHYRGVPIAGAKHRINQTCSAMGLVQLKHYSERITEIQKAMNYLSDGLDQIPGLKVMRIREKESNNGGWYAAHCYFDGNIVGCSVEEFVETLSAEGAVGVKPGCNAPLHIHNVFHDLDFFHQGMPTAIGFGQRDVRQSKDDLPNAMAANSHSFLLPWFKHFDREILDQYTEAFFKVAKGVKKTKRR